MKTKSEIIFFIIVFTILSFSIADGQGKQIVFCGYHLFTEYKTVEIDTQSNVKYIINMSLQKKEYKKYEPVIAKFEVINHDSLPININCFEPKAPFTGIIIYDEDNKSLGGNKAATGFWGDLPITEIQPGDTLVISMFINDWGKDTRKTSDNRKENFYFDLFGYFEPGNYKTHFYFTEYNYGLYETNIVSNEVNFTVIDLTNEDKEILLLLDNKNYLDIFNNYSNNPFTEHTEAERLYIGHWGSKRIKDDAEIDYDPFISKYPNSLYLINPRFMTPYLATIKSKNTDYQTGIEYGINKHPESDILRTALKNEALLIWIKNNVKFLENIEK